MRFRKKEIYKYFKRQIGFKEVATYREAGWKADLIEAIPSVKGIVGRKTAGSKLRLPGSLLQVSFQISVCKIAAKNIHIGANYIHIGTFFD